MSPNSTIFDLKQLGLDNEENDPIAANLIENNFYMNNFIKSVETQKKQSNSSDRNKRQQHEADRN